MSNRNVSGPIIAAYDVKKNFKTPAGALNILKGIHFTLDPAQMSFIIGRSGSGKSTLLNMLGVLDVPSSGKVVFEGEDTSKISERQRSRLRNLRVGFVFQSYHLLPELTLFENITLPSMIAGKKNDVWANELLKRVNLLDRKNHRPSELSGGEQQRAAIARSLMNRPSVVLCDEPTGNLDEETAQSVIQLMFDLNRQEGQSFVIVTHDEALAHRSENVFRLLDGVLLREDLNKDRSEPVG